MPEVILPCPLCGASEPKVNRGCGVVTCCEISVDNVAAWNALPRALRWTHEPPKVAGWYWRKDITTKDTIHICKIFYVDDASLFPPSEWAGPIAPPVDL